MNSLEPKLQAEEGRDGSHCETYGSSAINAMETESAVAGTRGGVDYYSEGSGDEAEDVFIDIETIDEECSSGNPGISGDGAGGSCGISESADALSCCSSGAGGGGGGGSGGSDQDYEAGADAHAAGEAHVGREQQLSGSPPRAGHGLGRLLKRHGWVESHGRYWRPGTERFRPADRRGKPPGSAEGVHYFTTLSGAEPFVRRNWENGEWSRSLDAADDVFQEADMSEKSLLHTQDRPHQEKKQKRVAAAAPTPTPHPPQLLQTAAPTYTMTTHFPSSQALPSTPDLPCPAHNEAATAEEETAALQATTPNASQEGLPAQPLPPQPPPPPLPAQPLLPLPAEALPAEPPSDDKELLCLMFKFGWEQLRPVRQEVSARWWRPGTRRLRNARNVVRADATVVEGLHYFPGERAAMAFVRRNWASDAWKNEVAPSPPSASPTTTPTAAPTASRSGKRPKHSRSGKHRRDRPAAAAAAAAAFPAESSPSEDFVVDICDDKEDEMGRVASHDGEDSTEQRQRRHEQEQEEQRRREQQRLKKRRKIGRQKATLEGKDPKGAKWGDVWTPLSNVGWTCDFAKGGIGDEIYWRPGALSLPEGERLEGWHYLLGMDKVRTFVQMWPDQIAVNVGPEAADAAPGALLTGSEALEGGGAAASAEAAGAVDGNGAAASLAAVNAFEGNENDFEREDQERAGGLMLGGGSGGGGGGSSGGGSGGGGSSTNAFGLAKVSNTRGRGGSSRAGSSSGGSGPLAAYSEPVPPNEPPAVSQGFFNMLILYGWTLGNEHGASVGKRWWRPGTEVCQKCGEGVEGLHYFSGDDAAERFVRGNWSSGKWRCPPPDPTTAETASSTAGPDNPRNPRRMVAPAPESAAPQPFEATVAARQPHDKVKAAITGKKRPLPSQEDDSAFEWAVPPPLTYGAVSSAPSTGQNRKEGASTLNAVTDNTSAWEVSEALEESEGAQSDAAESASSGSRYVQQTPESFVALSHSKWELLKRYLVAYGWSIRSASRGGRGRGLRYYRPGGRFAARFHKAKEGIHYFMSEKAVREFVRRRGIKAFDAVAMDEGSEPAAATAGQFAADAHEDAAISPPVEVLGAGSGGTEAGGVSSCAGSGDDGGKRLRGGCSGSEGESDVLEGGRLHSGGLCSGDAKSLLSGAAHSGAWASAPAPTSQADRSSASAWNGTMPSLRVDLRMSPQSGLSRASGPAEKLDSSDGSSSGSNSSGGGSSGSVSGGGSPGTVDPSSERSGKCHEWLEESDGAESSSSGGASSAAVELKTTFETPASTFWAKQPVESAGTAPLSSASSVGGFDQSYCGGPAAFAFATGDDRSGMDRDRQSDGDSFDAVAAARQARGRGGGAEATKPVRAFGILPWESNTNSSE